MNYIITGASSGIGRQCAIRLLKEGHNCLLLARSEKKLKELKNQFENASIYAMDLADLESIGQLFDDNNVLTPFDGLVHCAGVAPLKRTDENEIHVVRSTYEINVFSFIELMRYFVHESVCRNGASVVVMSSVVAHRGSNRQSIYAGTKAAIEATVRCMAKELICRNIRVNSIVSGTAETEMLQKLRDESPNLDEKIKKHSPLGVVPVDEICEVIEYLLSERSSHLTGVSFPIDSGYLL